MNANLSFKHPAKFAVILLISILAGFATFAQTPCAGDSTTADFSAGTTSGTTISSGGDGEVTLSPVRASEFTEFPPVEEWNAFPWKTGGSATVADGSLTVDGARFNTEPETLAFGPGSALEFVATFASTTFQHIGFGGGTDATADGGIYWGQHAWAMFSTGDNGILKARTFDGTNASNFEIPGTYTGAPHLYRIEWIAPSTFNYYIDGALVHTESAISISESMRVAISDFDPGTPLTVDWIRLSPPYSTSGTFESRVFDAGSMSAWGIASWIADVPANTALTISVRTGNTAVPDNKWTDYTVVSNGDDIGTASRYIQYKAEFTTTDPTVTPVLSSFSISNCIACTLKAAILSQTNVTCAGGDDGSVTIVAKKGTAPYQYRKNQNGVSQTDATLSNLKAGDWKIFVTDANGCTVIVKVTITEPARLQLINVEQTNVSTVGGHDGSVKVSATGGTAPYQYKKGKNGTYSSDSLFTRLKAGSYKIFARDTNGCETTLNVTITEPSAAVSQSSANALTNNLDLSFQVTPNPTTTDFRVTINGNMNEPVSINVFNMFGASVYKASGSITKVYGFGSELSPGIYVLEVSQGSKKKTTKIVKQ